MNGLTEEEFFLNELLGKCASLFVQLPKMHIADAPEFYQAIHVCQNIVLSRLAMRQMGMGEQRELAKTVQQNKDTA